MHHMLHSRVFFFRIVHDARVAPRSDGTLEQNFHGSYDSSEELGDDHCLL